MGLVFQDADAQIVGQTVARDAAFGPENLRLPREEINGRVEKALNATGLVGFDQRRPHTLSGGEKRRLCRGRGDCDEPRHPGARRTLHRPGLAGKFRPADSPHGLHRRGTTILLITHDLDKVLAHADRLVFMASGRIMVDGHA